MSSKNVKINAKKDLKLIMLISFIPVMIYLVLGSKILNFVKTSDLNVFIKCLPVILIQFGMAGLGSLVVMLKRKETLKNYGFVKNNLVMTIFLSFLTTIPHFLFMFFAGGINSYFPLQGSLVTRMFLSSSWPVNVIGYLICIIIWGFFEALSFIVIDDKINKIFQSKNKLLNYGAIICGIICILIHGMIGFSLVTFFEALTSFILIYGSLLVKDNLNNSYGVLFIFLFFWNAFR